MVVDFFKNLVRYRIEGVRSKANAKVYGATARAKSKASSKFNNAIDKPMKKAQAKAKNLGEKGKAKAKKGADKAKAKQKPKQQQKKAAAKEEKVGLFGKKNKGKQTVAEVEPVQAPAAMEGFDKTVAIDVSGLVDDRAQDVVGWVVCLNGALRGRDFRLVTGRNVMGTAADCDIVLTDPYLSSKHVAIRHEDGRFTLIDLDSTNGTYLNDRRVSKEELIDNDKIRIGRTELKFKSLF